MTAPNARPCPDCGKANPAEGHTCTAKETGKIIDLMDALRRALAKEDRDV